MLKVTLNSKNKSEKIYVLDYFLVDLFGLNVEYSFLDQECDICISGEKGKILIKDYFFSRIKENNFLSKDNIPKKISIFNQIKGLEVPIIFGENILETTSTEYILHLDIISSSFFMLSRWEEYVLGKYDKHNRVSGKDSLAYKNNFLNKPVVNYYIEILNYLLKKIGVYSNLQKRYKVIPTHDVDYISVNDLSTFRVFRTFVGDLLFRKKLIFAFNAMIEFFAAKSGFSRDFYDQFNYLMDISEKKGLQSIFFFMNDSHHIYDNTYKLDSPKTKKVINRIKERNHLLGIHPNYESFKSSKKIQKHLKNLENISKTKICFSRNHYLKYETPSSGIEISKTSVKVDFTLGYHDVPGFRSGICYEYPFYDFINGKTLNLINMPLIYMDVTPLTYQKKFEEKTILTTVLDLKNEIQKFQGNFTILWHNSSFNNRFWKKEPRIYEKIISCLCNE